MRSWFVKYLLPACAFLMLAFGCFHVFSSQPDKEKLMPPAQPPRSPYKNTVAAAGLVEARTENIAIGTAIPGVVLEVYVTSAEVGKYVSKGEKLFRVDDRNLQAMLKFQQANLASAEAQLAKLLAMPRPEEIPPSRAKARTAEANQRMLKDLADRAAIAVKEKVISQEDYNQRQLALEIARYQSEQASADLDLVLAGAWRPDKDINRSAVELAKAQIEQTKTEIERAMVRAPIAGHVLQVNVRPGEYVSTQANQSLVLMGDLTEYRVRVDIDEHDIPRFQTGAVARAFLRGHAQRELKLSFVRVEPYVIPKKSLTGDNTERVDTRVLQVIYAIDTKDQPVYIGQQLDVFIEMKK